MVKHPVIILGAGATKACGGPLTDEILPAALNGHIAEDDRMRRVENREGLLGLTRQFMTECFHVPQGVTVTKADCPSLPMVLSMLRRSIELNKPIGAWRGDRLIDARRAVEYSIFAVIEAALRSIPHRAGLLHRSLLEPLYQNGVEPTVISLNYDVIVDNTMFGLAEQIRNGAIPNYGVDIATPQYQTMKNNMNGFFGRLYKIHGSLNFLYCEKCSRLDLFVSEGQNGMHTSKALAELYYEAPFNDAYSCHGTRCRNSPHCDGFVNPILITPTFVKDYENLHIQKLWQEAETAMQQADRAIIIGYSLPTDDVEIGLLFKNGLGHLSQDRITIVEYVDKDSEKPVSQRTPLDQHPTGQRFRTLFGPGLDWHTTGFEGWIKEQGNGIYQ